MTTIDGINCYGIIKIGNAVEVITDRSSFIVDNEDHKNWASFVPYIKSRCAGVQELLADNL